MNVLFDQAMVQREAELSIAVTNAIGEPINPPGRLDIEYDRRADGASSVDITAAMGCNLGAVVDLVGTRDVVSVAMVFMEKTGQTVNITVSVNVGGANIATETVPFIVRVGSFGEDISLRYKWL